MSKYPLMVRTLGLIVIPLCALLWYGYVTVLSDSLPLKTGTQTVDGVNKSVIVSRDVNGVVKLQGDNDKDIYFAMGFVHAQDRFWQLEIQRRVSQGRLSEIFGRNAIEKDIWVRTLGIHKAAKAALEHLSPEALVALDAYTSGINAWLSTTKQLPVEFSILDINPEPWKNEDSMAWVKMFALNLSFNYKREIQRYIGSKYLKPAQLETFFETFDQSTLANTPTIDSDLFGALANINQRFIDEHQIGGDYVGSNAWVVSGKHTASGAPILANDPHLGLQIPSLWYGVHQKGHKLDVSGMSLVGIPFVVFGRNNNIAWGGTSMMADVQDLYLEQVNPLDSSQYKSTSGQWVPFETQVEKINVKAEFPAALRPSLRPVELTLRRTENGPVISDVVGGSNQVVTMRWTALDDKDGTFEAFYHLSFAKDWASFKKAMAHMTAPTLNILYADNDNNIGLLGVGNIPLRATGRGDVPSVGGDKNYQWLGYIPKDQMPQSFNPESGYIHNANNANVDESYPYFVSADFAPDFRAGRIEQLLNQSIEQGEDMTVEYMQLMQGDTKDISVLKLLTHLQKFEGRNEQQRQAVEFLRQWNANASMDSVGATIYYSWLRHLLRVMFSDELLADWSQFQQSNYLREMYSAVSADKLALLISEQSQWCDRVETVEIENCNIILEKSLQHMLKQMNKLAGKDMSDWQWGKLQQTVYKHTPFSEQQILDSIFERSISNGGAVNTINVASSFFDESKGYQQFFGAGFRQIMEMGPTQQRHVFNNSTGQSGHVLSHHYDDAVESFRDVKFFPMWDETGDIEQLTLIPQD